MSAPVMTTPPPMVPLGLTRDERHIYGWNDGREVRYPIPSVTTINKVLDKSGPLVGWAKRTVAEIAVKKLDVLAEMRATGGETAAIDWLKKLPDYQRDTAADMGTRIHFLADQISRGLEPLVTAEELPFVLAYRSFLAQFKPRFLAAEEMVVSLRHDYAGTLDAIAVVGGETWLWDIKTSSGVYPETALQLAAYGHAEFIGRSETPRKFRIPRPSRYGVLHVRPEFARLVEFNVTRATFAAFLFARRLYGWTQTEARSVIGPVLTATEKETAA